MENILNKKSNKRIRGIFATIITIIAVVFCLTGCFDTSNSSDLDKFQVTNTNMTYEYNEYTNDYDIIITGKAKNITDEDFSYVSIEFTIFNAQGESIGICDAYISGLSAGETWSFEATLYWCEEFPASFKLFDITCY